MDTKSFEFSTVNTIKTIDGNQRLERLYDKESKTPFDYDKLIEDAKNKTLADEAINALYNIFSSIILIEDVVFNVYDTKSKVVLSEGDYNHIRIIKLINKDSLLQKVYTGSVEKWQFRKLIEAAKDDRLTPEQSKGLENIYVSVLYSSEFHMELYNDTKEVRRKTPTRYGKKDLQADIAAQDGKATPIQETLLLVAELTTLKDRLSKRCINDHYRGTEQIPEDDHSKIQEFLKGFNTQLKLLLGDNFSTNGTRG